ncbi:MAG: response regulator [Pseudomonadota bacterium]|nr:response regulator [Pseudomonadota bacterium]
MNSSVKYLAQPDALDRAEALLQSYPQSVADVPPGDMRRLVQDLHQHQTELERQNEELKRTREELAESYSKYCDLYDFAPVGCLTLDPQETIIEANHAAAALLMIGRQQLLQKKITDFIMPEDRGVYDAQARRITEEGGRCHCEVRLRRTDGTSFHAQIETLVWQPKSGGMPQRRVAISNISDQAEALSHLQEICRRAEEANRAKSEFLANMSHEIRTPLNAIIGLANILASSSYNPKQYALYLQTLGESAESLLGLVNGMLDFAKIESGKVTLEAEPFDLRDLIGHVRRIGAVKAQEKGLALYLHYPAGLPVTFVGDSMRIRQILINLMSNAIKFTEKGSVTINVAGGEPDQEGRIPLALTVADTGIGISEDKLEPIFQKFIQQDASTEKQYGGTGLGLAISRELARLMGGNVTAKSRVGEGSEFTLHLKLYPERSITLPWRVQEKEKPASALNGKNKNLPPVLLVEDYHANILVAAMLLEDLGYHYKVAKDGDEALAMLERERFSLVLMDVRMPGKDGLETTRIIRSREKEKGLPPVPIVALTAHAFAEDREKCLTVGMNDYIAKPFRMEALAEKLQGLIGNYRDAEGMVA